MKQISKLVDRQKDKIIALAKKLIDIPTINPPGLNYERFVVFLEHCCQDVGLKTSRYVVPVVELKKLGITAGSPRINLVARWNNGAKKTLHINSHYDVVPATGNWKTDPFRAIVKDGKLFGRGSEDMKANIACMVYAVDILKKLKRVPRVNLELSFTPDEETGGRAGMAYLFAKGLVKADYALGEGFEDDYVSVGNKGMLWLEIEVLGKSAHSSTPYLGKNSFEQMITLVCELMRFKKQLKLRKTKYGTKNKLDAYSTMVIGGMCAGGKKINIVPDSTIFSIDRRLIPEEDIVQAKKEIKQIIKKVQKKNKKLKLRIKTVTEEKPVVTKTDNCLLDVFSQSVKVVLRKRLKTALMPGGTDLRYFIRRGIPSLGYSVKGENRAHADDEFVYTDSIVKTTKIFALLMNNLSA